MKDWLLMIFSRITREEYAHRKVQKQSVSEWYSDYDKAIKTQRIRPKIDAG